MPTYTYRCPNGHELTDLEPISAPTQRICQECTPSEGQHTNVNVYMQRIITATQPPIFKGGAPTRKFHRRG